MATSPYQPDRDPRARASQIAVRLVDEFTGAAPIGQVDVHLEVKERGRWKRADHAHCVVTPLSVVVCPGLEQHTLVVWPPRPRRYRLIVEAEYYAPLYPMAEGLEIDVFPYNQANPPPVPDTPQDLYLLPTPRYPFAPHLRVLRGWVQDRRGARVAGAFVREGMRERVLTDDRGAFSLPLRWPRLDATVVIDAGHVTGKTGSIQISLPDALGHDHIITIQ